MVTSTCFELLQARPTLSPDAASCCTRTLGTVGLQHPSRSSRHANGAHCITSCHPLREPSPLPPNVPYSTGSERSQDTIPDLLTPDMKKETPFCELNVLLLYLSLSCSRLIFPSSHHHSPSLKGNYYLQETPNCIPTAGSSSSLQPAPAPHDCTMATSSNTLAFPLLRATPTRSFPVLPFPIPSHPIPSVI